MTDFALNYLLNALWQAPVLFAAAWLLALLVRRLGPLAEHRLWVATLFAQCVLPAVAIPGLGTALRAWLAGGDAADGSVIVTLQVAEPLLSRGRAMTWHVVLALYCGLVVFYALRFAWQSLRLRSLVERADRTSLPEQAQTFLNTSLRRLSLQCVDVRKSAAVRTPFVFGLRRPALLLPGGFVELVSEPQLFAALAHELVHVQRRDVAKQMLYRCLALPLCFHPATAATLARIAESREQVCDDLAATLTRGKRSYANSLLGLASLLAAPRPAPIPAVGIFDARHLERRILMLHHPLPIASHTRRTLTLAATALAAVATCTSALALHQHVDASVEAPSVGNSATQDGPATKVAGGVMAGQILSRTAPKYPEEAKQARIQGIVVLKAIIGKDGSIANLQVVSGPEELRASAIDAVRQWVYQPYLLNGEPTEVDTNITVNYSLGDDPVPSGESSSQSASKAAPNAATDQPTQPKLLSSVHPDYPEAARKAKIGGAVMVALKVGENGRVSDVHAVSGPPELRAAATDAVAKYLFQPAMLHGQPAAVAMRVEVKFETF